MAAGRYLILRLSALGDVVFALESLAAIRAAEPDAVVDWVVEDRAAGLLRGHPWVNEVLVYPRRRLSRMLARPWLWLHAARELGRHGRRLRRTAYDAVLDLHGNFKSGLHVWFARGRRKIGFSRARARELSWLAVRERVDLGTRAGHRAEQGLQLVAQLLGREPPDVEGPLIPVREKAAREADACLARHPRGTGGPLVCIAPGSSGFAAFKRWPAARHRDLALALQREGARVVLCTGPGEDALAAAIGTAPDILWCDGGRLGLPVYLEVLRRADVLVAADSGPLHMAQAVGTKTVALFGPKDPAIYGPRRTRSIVLRYPVPCVPCGRRDCDAPICVQGIPVDDVRAAVRELIAAG